MLRQRADLRFWSPSGWVRDPGVFAVIPAGDARYLTGVPGEGARELSQSHY